MEDKKEKVIELLEKFQSEHFSNVECDTCQCGHNEFFNLIEEVERVFDDSSSNKESESPTAVDVLQSYHNLEFVLNTLLLETLPNRLNYGCVNKLKDSIQHLGDKTVKFKRNFVFSLDANNNLIVDYMSEDGVTLLGRYNFGTNDIEGDLVIGYLEEDNISDDESINLQKFNELIENDIRRIECLINDEKEFNILFNDYFGIGAR